MTALALLVQMIPAEGGGDAGPTTTGPTFQADAPTLLAYISFAVATIAGVAQALSTFAGRRRRKDAAATLEQTQAATGAIRDGTQLDWRKQESAELTAERTYSAEMRERARATDDELRLVKDRLDGVEDRLRLFSRTVLSCPVPNPPGCPLAPIARATALDEADPVDSP